MLTDAVSVWTQRLQITFRGDANLLACLVQLPGGYEVAGWPTVPISQVGTWGASWRFLKVTGPAVSPALSTGVWGL